MTGVPDVPGLAVESVEAGSRLRLAWSGPGTLVVLDSDGAPYLRLTPQGVETNTDSRASWLDRDRRGLTVVPPGVDSRGEPVWERTSGPPEVLWHEHRAHWTGTEPPEGVSGGGGAQRVRDWSLPLQLDGRPLAVTGTLDYVPGPSPLPYVALIVVAAAGAALAVRAGRAGAAACLVVVAADMVRALGTGLTAADQPVQALAAAIGLAGVGWVLLLVAAAGLLRGRSGAVVLAAVGGALVALSGALPDSGSLAASLPLTIWPAVVQRGAVAVSLGAGLGLLLGLVAAFKRLSAEQERLAGSLSPAPSAT